MAIPTRDELVDALRATPGAARLLDVVGDIPGVHLVGGVPRDLLLGRPPLDLDLVVEGDGPAVAAIIADRMGGTAVTHDRVATAVVSAGDMVFDVASARAEEYRQPGALPDVRPARLEEDLQRRDFSVNAIAIALWAAELGRVRALPSALEDLEAHRLRVLHAGSFHDDPTRLLRLVRYATRLGFAIEPETAGLAREAAGAGALATVSAARIGSELRLALAEESAVAALMLAGSLGIAAALHPGFTVDAAIAGRALALLPADGRRDLLVLAVACRAMGGPDLAGWLDGMEFRGPDRDEVIDAVTAPAVLSARLAAATQPSQIAAAAAGHPPATVALAGALGAERAARAWLDDLRHVRVDIAGADLLAAGVAQGPDVGRALAAALAARLDGGAEDRAAQLRAALAAVGRE